jgi:hypothetical protein
MMDAMRISHHHNHSTRLRHCRDSSKEKVVQSYVKAVLTEINCGCYCFLIYLTTVSHFLRIGLCVLQMGEIWKEAVVTSSVCPEGMMKITANPNEGS